QRRGNIFGIYLGSSSHNLIQSNLTSANNGGLVIFSPASSNNIVVGNLIGTDLTGTRTNLGNGGGVGIDGGWMSQVASNTIAFNSSAGIGIVGAARYNRVTQNRIYANGALGIDLGNDAMVAPNDPGDTDTGPNNLQNYPVLTAAATSGSTKVQGTL